MVLFRIDIKSIKRSAGQRATAAAAYRAGERIRDERTGKVHNHSRRKDVRHAEIFLPSKFGEAPMEWARDRTTLWNAAESAEKRRDARVAREFQVALPSELSSTQRLALARGFARELSDRYGVAVDLAIHDPKPGADPRHFHAHLLATTREVTPTGLGAKAGLDMQVVQRARQGMADPSEEYSAVRERWAFHMNEAFRDANVEARVDHRSLAAQGIDRQPMVYVPMEFYGSQIKGLKPGELARLRDDYRARVAARLDHSRQRAPAEQAAPPAEKTIDPRNVEEIRRHAVESWLRMRSKEAESSLEKGAASEDNQQRLGERPLQADRSTEGSPPLDADRRRAAEQGYDRDRQDSAASSGHEDDAGM
jgi:ATP-dependent exoDNAse (exonuclease V) alpha subunit